jgi:hypothetical protein
MLAKAWQELAPIIAIIAVVVGWALHELSDTIRLNREDRRVAGAVLAELLEIRNGIRAVPLVLDQIRKRAPIPAEAEAPVRSFCSTLVVQMTAGLPERFNKSVDSLAGRLPLLAFELRSKDRLDPMLNQLRALVANDPNASLLLPTIEDNLRGEFLPKIDALVLRLAWLHGWKTWIRVRWRSRTLDQISPEVKKRLDILFKRLNLPSTENLPPKNEL